MGIRVTSLSFVLLGFIGLSMPLEGLAKAKVIPASCVLDPLDPFEPGEESRITYGPHKGDCQTSDVKRSIKLLTPEEAKPYGPMADEMVLANFYHNGQFYIAKISKNTRMEAILQVAPFKVLGAHMQIRFITAADTPITLIPQSKAKSLDPIETVRDFIFSGEFSSSRGVKYGMIAGLHKVVGKRFGLVYRLKSTRSYVGVETFAKGQVQQYKLKITEDEALGTLNNAIYLGTQAGMHEIYDTVSKSCTTEAVHAIIGAVPKEKINYDPDDLFHLDETKTFYPNVVPKVFKKWGLLDDQSKMTDFYSTSVID